IHMAQPPSTEGNLSLRGYRTPTPGLVQFAKELSTAGRAKGRDAFRRGPSRPGRNRTCNPRFWSALPATPALKRSLIFNDLAGRPATPASLDNAGVGTNPGTAEYPPWACAHARERVALARRVIRRILRMC